MGISVFRNNSSGDSHKTDSYSKEGEHIMKRKKVGKALLILVLVFAILIGGGFAYLYLHGMSGLTDTTDAEEGQVRVACVGDSITYGHGITNWPQNHYPRQLQRLLGDGYHVNNYGVSSFAVQDTSDRPYTTLEHYRESLAYDADYVVFMMGTNDSKPENWIDAAHFREDLISLLESYGDAQIILCTVPSAFFLEGKTQGVTSHDIQPLVADEIAGVIRQVAQENGYTLLDIHALTAQNPQWFAKDGVHPNNDGAAAIAQEVCKVLTGK